MNEEEYSPNLELIQALLQRENGQEPAAITALTRNYLTQA
jgi:hypothetical protein